MLHFLNPALLFGALLFAVPLIIHLLNRQRYRRRPWAAMEFLLAAYKKQRRRLRAENLLLLLLRCLIPLVLAFAIARPSLRDSAVSGLLGGACHHVLVLDATYSTGLLSEGAATPFDRQKALAGQLLERIGSKQGHKVSVAIAGVRPVWPVQDELGAAHAQAVVAALQGPQDAATDLLEVLRQTADLVERAADPELRVYLFSDLQARAFGEDLAAAAQPETARTDPGAVFQDTARDSLDRIQKKAELIVLDIARIHAAGVRTDNLQVTGLTLGTRHAIARVTTPVVATVRNLSDQGKSFQVTLEIEGGEPTRKTMRLDAGAEGQLEFPVTFREIGQRRLEAHVEGDALPADNERFLVVDVRERIRVLAVEGSNETEASLRETTHLLDVLDPTRGKGKPEETPFATSVIDSLAFLSRPPRADEYDLLALCNVERVDETAAAAILEAMQAGKGLLLLLGDRCDVQSYNRWLWRDGKGPLPMRLTHALGYAPGGDEYYGFTVTAGAHPVFADLDQDVYRDIFKMTPIYKLVGSDTQQLAKETLVLARARDPEQSALVVAGTCGNGKSLVLTSAIARTPERWNRLDDAWIAWPLLHQSAYWLTVPLDDPFHVAVGMPLIATLADRPSNVTVVVSERAGGHKVPVGDEPKALPGGRFVMPPFRRTEFAGLYLAEMQLGKSGEGRPAQLWFAANVEPKEGVPGYWSHATAKERLGVPRVLEGLPDEARSLVTSGSSELGPFLLHLVLFFVLGEAALARLVSQRRS